MAVPALQPIYIPPPIQHSVSAYCYLSYLYGRVNGEESLQLLREKWKEGLKQQDEGETSKCAGLCLDDGGVLFS